MKSLVCPSDITLTADGVPECSDGWIQVNYVLPFDPTAVDPAVIAGVFGSGFTVIITVWAAAFGLSQLVKFIRR